MRLHMGSKNITNIRQGTSSVNFYLESKLVSDITQDSFDNYNRLDYIQSNGKSWINTGVKPTTTLLSKMKFVMTYYAGASFLGTTDAGKNETNNDLNYEHDENDYRFFRGKDGVTYFDMLKGRIQCNWITSTSSVYEVELGNYYIKNLANGNKVASGSKQSFNWMTTNRIVLFGTTEYGKVYYLKMWDGDILIRDFIPCERKRDGAVGMYDLANNKFYKSQGSENFIKGNYI